MKNRRGHRANRTRPWPPQRKRRRPPVAGEAAEATGADQFGWLRELLEQARVDVVVAFLRRGKAKR